MRPGFLLTACLLLGCSAYLDSPGAPDAGRRVDLAEPWPADLARPPSPDLAPTVAGPPYPIILVHGMAGFRSIGPLDYFYGVTDNRGGDGHDLDGPLTRDGHDVWISLTDPLNTSEVRGPQLKAYVEDVLQNTGSARVVLVGHSQGGFDARYVASEMGDRIAAVITIATPHGGAPVADVITGAVPGAAQVMLAAFLAIYGLALGDYDTDLRAQLENLSSAGAAAFFARHPDDPRVAYYSIGGRSSMVPGDLECWTPTPAPFVARWNQDVDPLNPLFLIPGALMDNQDPAPTHDGLVPVGSSRHGTFLGCVPADHLDEIGLFPGATPGRGNDFDHVQFYRDLASWIVQQGY